MPILPYGQDKTVIQSCKILSGDSLSNAVNLQDNGLVTIFMPSAWTAASITFQVSFDDSTYYNYYDIEGGEYTVVATAGVAIVVNPADFPGVDYLKIRSGTASVPVNQGADAVVNLAIRSL